MKYLITYKEEQIARVEITDQNRLVQLIEAEEGREVEEPLDFFFESICELILENPDCNFDFLAEDGAKVEILYRRPAFEKCEVKSELV